MYGYSTPDSPVELVNLGWSASVTSRVPRFLGLTAATPARRSPWSYDRSISPKAAGRRRRSTPSTPCCGGRAARTKPSSRTRSTMLILPGQHGEIDGFRNLHIYEAPK